MTCLGIKQPTFLISLNNISEYLFLYQDLFITMEVLYQLSYNGLKNKIQPFEALLNFFYIK